MNMGTDKQVTLLKVVCACAILPLIILGSEWGNQGLRVWSNAAFLSATAFAATWFILREKDLSGIGIQGRWAVAGYMMLAAYLPYMIVRMSRPPGGGWSDVRFQDVALLGSIIAVGFLLGYRAYSLRARQLAHVAAVESAAAGAATNKGTDKHVTLLKVVCLCAVVPLTILGFGWDDLGLPIRSNAAVLAAMAFAVTWHILREKDPSRMRGRWAAARYMLFGALISYVYLMTLRPPGGSLSDVHFRDAALIGSIIVLGCWLWYRAYSLRARQLSEGSPT